ncbi:MAG: GNAT family N-acetyltransferase [Candidatus Marinimicrobia bacterium]|nr:GNAT family N-acetyltransferase [Candidatus Neomarinimicrobiota bacterium]
MFILTTPRLTLRQIVLHDAEFMLRLLRSPGWLNHIGDRNVHSIADAESYLSTKVIPNYEKFGFGFYLMETRDKGTQVGICGLVQRTGLVDADIGYALLPEYEGLGYALEAARATLEYGYQVHQLERIVAITSENNQRSTSLLKKLGMNYEKMIKLPDDEESLMLFSHEIK